MLKGPTDEGTHTQESGPFMMIFAALHLVEALSFVYLDDTSCFERVSLLWHGGVWKYWTFLRFWKSTKSTGWPFSLLREKFISRDWIYFDWDSFKLLIMWKYSLKTKLTFRCNSNSDCHYLYLGVTIVAAATRVYSSMCGHQYDFIFDSSRWPTDLNFWKGICPMFINCNWIPWSWG